jgi:hypothetical protein
MNFGISELKRYIFFYFPFNFFELFKSNNSGNFIARFVFINKNYKL